MPSPFARADLLDPSTPTGALAWGALLLLLASLAALLVRRGARRVERGLSDVTLLQFASVFVQLLVYLLALVLFAHLVPPLRAFGTALLAGASVASVVVGLAAQDTLGNVVAGISLVLSRTVRVGDAIRLYCPVGGSTRRCARSRWPSPRWPTRTATRWSCPTA